MKTKTSKTPARPWTAKSKARAAKLETPPLPAPPAAKPKARKAPEAPAAALQPAPLALLPALTPAAPPAAAPVAAQQPAPAAAPKAPRNLDKAPAAVGRPVRAGTMNGNIVAALLRGSTIDEIRQCGPDWDRGRATARLWGVWKAAGIGYKVSEGGRYTIDLPPNLTPETAIKQVAAGG